VSDRVEHQALHSRTQTHHSHSYRGLGYTMRGSTPVSSLRMACHVFGGALGGLPDPPSSLSDDGDTGRTTCPRPAITHVLPYASTCAWQHQPRLCVPRKDEQERGIVKVPSCQASKKPSLHAFFPPPLPPSCPHPTTLPSGRAHRATTSSRPCFTLGAEGRTGNAGTEARTTKSCPRRLRASGIRPWSRSPVAVVGRERGRERGR